MKHGHVHVGDLSVPPPWDASPGLIPSFDTMQCAVSFSFFEETILTCSGSNNSETNLALNHQPDSKSDNT